MNSSKCRYSNVKAIGMDVHYKFSRYSMRDADGKVVYRGRLDHPGRKQLREKLGQWPRGVPIVMEASFGHGWLADEMLALGLEPALANCFKVAKMREARGLAKNNKKDADSMSELPFESRPWWKVWLIESEMRDYRERLRYRSGLVAIQTQTKNRIHAVFHRQGIFHEYSDLFGSRGREFLLELVKAGRTEEVALPAGAWETLGSHIRLLDHVRGQLAQVARRLRQVLTKTPAAKLLDTAPGIGLILAHTILAEIGDIGRFPTHRQLASYSLLAPICDDSGEENASKKPLGRHLGHRGNVTLKWAFIEAAHGAVRHGGKWRAMWDWHTNGGQQDRNRGYIVVARELVRVVHAMLRKNEAYREIPSARPGIKIRRRRGGSTRSVKSQSQHPMAGVREDSRTSL